MSTKEPNDQNRQETSETESPREIAASDDVWRLACPRGHTICRDVPDEADRVRCHTCRQNYLLEELDDRASSEWLPAWARPGGRDADD